MVRMAPRPLYGVLVRGGQRLTTRKTRANQKAVKKYAKGQLVTSPRTRGEIRGPKWPNRQNSQKNPRFLGDWKLKMVPEHMVKLDLESLNWLLIEGSYPHCHKSFLEGYTAALQYVLDASTTTPIEQFRAWAKEHN